MNVVIYLTEDQDKLGLYKKKQMKYALKEWNATIEALGKGTIVAIWRKGNIQATASVRAEFVLFPTFIHETPGKIKKEYWLTNGNNLELNKDNQVKIKYWAEVEEEVVVETLDGLLAVSKALINTEEYLQSSWNLYPDHRGKILFLRVYMLKDPILVTNSKEYIDCKSWIELKINIPKIGSRPVLSYKDFNQKARFIKALLEQATPQKVLV